MSTDGLRGSMTALVTPFTKTGEVDFDNYAKLVERQIASGTNALIPGGTTGEGSTLTIAEHQSVIEACVAQTKSRVPVIAGVGANDTPVSIALAQTAQKAGADALLAATGYYNRPSQRGLIAHYQTLAEATDLPIILYNVPGRTACDIHVDTMAALVEHPQIIGVKDATGDLARVALQRLACGKDFIQLSGEDMTAVGFNAMGGVGCISVTANVMPDLCAQMHQACLSGDWASALAYQDKLAPLHAALFADTNPTPVKYALSRLGLIENEVRLPMVPASEAAMAMVDAALEGLGLL